jgi:Flp pilus assembly protein TadD/predicted O-methyltransferase YrrM
MIEREFLAEQLDSGRALHRAGNLQEAELRYLGVLALEPGHAEALKLLAVIALDRGDLARAAHLAGSALAVRPEAGECWHRLGRIRLRQGDFQEASTCLSRAVASDPPEPTRALLDLSACLAKLKVWPQSLAAASRVIEAEPDHELAHRLAGHACFALERDDETLGHFDRVLASDASEHALWHLTSLSCLRLGRASDAHARSVRACLLAPENSEYSLQRRLAGAAAVPDWHFNMVNDEPRNAAFSAAIAAVVKPEHRVLEIGTGSGLLAMLAARGEDGGARAAQVVTCESNPLLARTATDIVAANGLAERVHVVAKPSSELRVGIDLQARADVLICEIFSVQVIAEGVLPALEDAKSRLLTSDAIVIPRAAAARSALVAGEELSRRTRARTVHGFDLSLLNEYTPALQYLSPEQTLTLLSAPTDLFRFDLANSQQFPAERRSLRVVASASGLCQGVVQWLRLELCAGVEFENPPGTAVAAASRHWHPVFYPFVEPVLVGEGQSVTLRASHNRRGIRVEFVDLA